MQQYDLEPFVQFIKQRNLVDERHLPFYVKWVQRFLTAELPPIAASATDRIQAFENLLSKDRGIEEWQIRQALRAVELYVKVFATTGKQEAVRAGDPDKAISDAEGVYTQMRDLIRIRHYAYRTEQTYLDWVRRYLAYALKHELDWRQSDSARAYISSLATQQDVAASTQNQAFAALLFLLREVLKQENPDLKSVRARQGTRLPVVLSQEEVRQVLKMTPVADRLLLQLAYGAGLRVSELIRLRVKDLDFDNRLVIVRAGKGNKDRGTLMSKALVDPLKAQIQAVKRVHEQDLASGHGAVYLPFALDRKYPAAPKEFGWQYLFPANDLAVDPRSGVVRRHHISDQVPQRIMRDAVRKAGIDKPASIHCMRHSFATHMLLKGVNIREVQKYLGHESVETTMIYTHVIRGMDSTAESPLDEL
jgi:integron integrase